MNFTYLNKACPKDAYPLLIIDKLVDGTSEAEFLNVMDAYFGYNQIRIHTIDEEKMTLIIESANYCYKAMQF